MVVASRPAFAGDQLAPPSSVSKSPPCTAPARTRPGELGSTARSRASEGSFPAARQVAPPSELVSRNVAGGEKTEGPKKTDSWPLEPPTTYAGPPAAAEETEPIQLSPKSLLTSTPAPSMAT